MYRIFVPVHLGTQNVIAEWVGFLGGLLEKLVNPINWINLKGEIEKLADDVNLNGRALKKELKKIVALYEKAQQDETIKNIVNNINLKIELKQTTYGLTKYYYISLVYESQKIHPLIFHKALLLTNQSASFFSTILFSRFEDTSKYDKIKEFEIVYEYNLITNRKVFPITRGDRQEIAEQFMRQYLSYPPYSELKKIDYSLLSYEKVASWTYEVQMTLFSATYKVKFPYISGTINEETLEGDLELLPIMPPFWRKDGKPQLVFANDYIVPQKITINISESKKGNRLKERLKEKSEQKSQQEQEQQKEKKINLVPILGLLALAVIVGGKLK